MNKSQPQRSLSVLAAQYGSDKSMLGHRAHGYTRIYEPLLAGVRNRPLRILEIGLLHPDRQIVGNTTVYEDCPSLRMWADYLSNANIYGLDLKDFSGFRHGRVIVQQCDQSSREELLRVVRLIGGGFDLIIDDGSHASPHQQVSLGMLFPYLSPGGWYVVEDLHYQPSELERTDVAKTRKLLEELARGVPLHGFPSAFSPQEIDRISNETESVIFFDSLSDGLYSRDALGIITRKRDVDRTGGDPVAMLIGSISRMISHIASKGHCWTGDRELWIWGAGSGGSRVLRLLVQAGARVKGFVDGDKRKAGSEVDDCTVCSPGGFARQMRKRAFVVIASQFVSEIGRELKAMNLRHSFDYVSADFEAVSQLEATQD